MGNPLPNEQHLSFNLCENTKMYLCHHIRNSLVSLAYYIEKRDPEGIQKTIDHIDEDIARLTGC